MNEHKTGQGARDEFPGERYLPPSCLFFLRRQWRSAGGRFVFMLPLVLCCLFGVYVVLHQLGYVSFVPPVNRGGQWFRWMVYLFVFYFPVTFLFTGRKPSVLNAPESVLLTSMGWRGYVWGRWCYYSLLASYYFISLLPLLLGVCMWNAGDYFHYILAYIMAYCWGLCLLACSLWLMRLPVLYRILGGFVFLTGLLISTFFTYTISYGRLYHVFTSGDVYIFPGWMGVLWLSGYAFLVLARREVTSGYRKDIFLFRKIIWGLSLMPVLAGCLLYGSGLEEMSGEDIYFLYVVSFCLVLFFSLFDLLDHRAGGVFSTADRGIGHSVVLFLKRSCWQGAVLAFTLAMFPFYLASHFSFSAISFGSGISSSLLLWWANIVFVVTVVQLFIKRRRFLFPTALLFYALLGIGLKVIAENLFAEKSYFSFFPVLNLFIQENDTGMEKVGNVFFISTVLTVYVLSCFSFRKVRRRGRRCFLESENKRI